MKLKKKVILESLDGAAALYQKEMPIGAAALWLHNILELNRGAATIREEIRTDTEGENEERLGEIMREIGEEEMELSLRQVPIGMMGDLRVSPAVVHGVIFLMK